MPHLDRPSGRRALAEGRSVTAGQRLARARLERFSTDIERVSGRSWPRPMADQP
ncbi:hypothetical protein [Streptomyces sp. NPDC057438]|uniref:hypothetical protein n=1 Tax=Streptomyces sp. NPDC057438 TaxID=3346133 RepID=UPI0036B6AAEA